jgi:hypothetical protein
LKGNQRQIEGNQEAREASRNRLMAHLGTVAHKTYKPANLSELEKRIGGYMSERERLEKELAVKEEMMKNFGVSVGELKDEIANIARLKEELEIKIAEEVAKYIETNETTLFGSVSYGATTGAGLGAAAGTCLEPGLGTFAGGILGFTTGTVGGFAY